MEGNSVAGTSTIASVREQQEAKIWHQRLEHVSELGLKHLITQGLLGKITIETLGVCELCIYAKTSRVSFGKGKHVSKGSLTMSILIFEGQKKYLLWGMQIFALIG